MAFSNHALGKSLSDVFARTPRKDGGKGYLEVDINAIIAPADNPRKSFDEEALKELAESVRKHGVLQPIVVMKRGGGFEIISGERRFRAAKLAGLAQVPVVVREEDNPQHVGELRLIENIQRENLNPIELARAFHALIDRHGLTHEELAERVSKDRSSITNSLRLLSLPSSIHDEIISGSISMGHAKALVGIADQAWLLHVARRIVEEQLSVREVEKLAKEVRKAPAPSAPAPAPTATHLRELETNLYHLFGSRVKIKERRGKGAMTVMFDSKEQFQRVLAIMEKVLKQSNQG